MYQFFESAGFFSPIKLLISYDLVSFFVSLGILTACNTCKLHVLTSLY